MLLPLRARSPLPAELGVPLHPCAVREDDHIAHVDRAIRGRPRRRCPATSLSLPIVMPWAASRTRPQDREGARM